MKWSDLKVTYNSAKMLRYENSGHDYSVEIYPEIIGSKKRYFVDVIIGMNNRVVSLGEFGSQKDAVARAKQYVNG